MHEGSLFKYAKWPVSPVLQTPDLPSIFSYLYTITGMVMVKFDMSTEVGKGRFQK